MIYDSELATDQKGIPAGYVSEYVESPSTDIPPFMKPAGKEKTNTFAKYRFICNIESVCYMPEGKQHEWGLKERQRACAVLLKVTFNLADATLASALIPTHVAVPVDISKSFPCDDETVKLSEHLVTDHLKLSPNIKFAGAGVSLGEVSRQGNKKLYGFLHLNRVVIPGEHDIQIHWNFINKKSNYFPQSIRLLVVATKTGGLPRFPFKLQILSSVRVVLHEKWRPLLAAHGPKENRGGWTFDICPEYCEERAMEVFHDCRTARKEQRRSHTVGLHPAVSEYLQAVSS